MAPSGYSLFNKTRWTILQKVFFFPVANLFLASVLMLFVSCEKNHPPIIAEISQNPANTSAGTIYTFTVSATDEDGDILTYLWTSTGGEFLSPLDEKEVDWRSPYDGNGEDFILKVLVSDGEFEESKEHLLGLTEPVLGGILGTVCFSQTKVPIEGVRVWVGNNETVTDDRGEYTLSGIIARKDTVKANKTDFSPKESVVDIPPEAVLHLDWELVSITHSTKLSGRITDQDGETVNNVEVVVLNPNGSESRLKAFTDDNGQYRILYIPHGTRTLLVRKVISDDFKVIGLEETIEFSEIESRMDFEIEKVPLRGSFTDIRDGQEYPYKTIGEQTWMITNLAYLPMVNPPEDLSNSLPYMYVYGYWGTDTAEAKGLERYRHFGALYNWTAAQKICPFGWHLPSREEWFELITLLNPGSGPSMRTTSGWEDNGGGNNSSGFSALPAGILSENGKFTGINSSAYFQTSTNKNAAKSYYVALLSGWNSAWSQSGYMRTAYSVRCIRDK